MKKMSCVLILCFLCVPVTHVLAATQRTDPQSTIEKTRLKVAKLGVGEKAKATIKLNDGTRVKGYVYSAGDEDFVIRDKQTSGATKIRYADVKSVDDNRGHSMARNILIAVGIGAAVTVVAVYGAIARNER